MVRQRGGFPVSQRRKTQWAGFGDTAGAANLPTLVSSAAGASVIVSQALIVGGGSGLVDEEVTVTRMIGSWTASISATTGSLIATVAIGCAIVRLETIGVGVAALPSVETDPDFEWLYYGGMILRAPNSTMQDGPLSSVVVPFDVKGQRIVHAGESMVWIAEAQTQTVFVGVTGRALVKLT